MSRGIWSKVFRNFIDSLKPRHLRRGTLVGQDYMNNKYYEIPADPQGGKRNPTRWFEPVVKNKFDQEIPAEWEAWLRGRRAQVPDPDEIARNVAIAQMKKENAKKVAIENPFIINETQQLAPKSDFPVYEDYELPHKNDR